MLCSPQPRSRNPAAGKRPGNPPVEAGRYFAVSMPGELDQRRQSSIASPTHARRPGWQDQSNGHSRKTNPSPGRRIHVLDPTRRYGLPNHHGKRPDAPHRETREPRLLPGPKPSSGDRAGEAPHRLESGTSQHPRKKTVDLPANHEAGPHPPRTPHPAGAAVRPVTLRQRGKGSRQQIPWRPHIRHRSRGPVPGTGALPTPYRAESHRQAFVSDACVQP